MDPAFHLRAGEWIWAHGLPVSDNFTVGPDARPYVDLSWFYQVLVYQVHRFWGWTGLSIFHYGIWIGLIALLWRRLRQATNSRVLMAAALVASAEIVAWRIAARPEPLGWCCLLAMLLVLEQYRTDGRAPLWILPAAQLVYANVHGTFVYGWVVLFAYAAEHVVHRRTFEKRFGLFLLAAFVSPLLNPSGWHALLHPFQLAVTAARTPEFTREINELFSPWSYGGHFLPLLADSDPIFYLVSVLAIVLAVIRWRELHIHEWILLVVFWMLANASMRTTPLLAIVIMPMAVGWMHSWLRTSISRGFFSHWRRLQVPAAVAIVILSLTESVRVVDGAYYSYAGAPPLFRLGIDRTSTNIGWEQWVLGHGLTGKILPDPNTGSAVIWALKQRPYFHGSMEILGPTMFRRYLETRTEKGLLRLIQETQPDMVLLELTGTPQWMLILNRSPEWRLIYWDIRVALYARNGYATELPAIAVGSLAEQEGSPLPPAEELLPLLFNREQNWLERWWLPRPYAPSLSAADMAFALHDTAAAAQMVFPAVRERASNLVFHGALVVLGSYFDQSKRAPEALICYARATKLDPTDSRSEDLLRRIDQAAHE